MKLNLQKTTAAVLAVVFSVGAFAANNAYNPFEYATKITNTAKNGASLHLKPKAKK